MKKPAHVVEIFLQPGDFYFGDANIRIRTILGSCVSITMWHPVHLIGGMCHYMLPARPHATEQTLDGRYGEDAMRLFLREIRRSKTHPSEYRVKLFGAGNMFPALKQKHLGKTGSSVSDKNLAMAHALIQQHGFRVDAQDLGGEGHRQVIFDIWSGYAWVKKPPLTKLNSRGPK